MPDGFDKVVEWREQGVPDQEILTRVSRHAHVAHSSGASLKEIADYYSTPVSTLEDMKKYWRSEIDKQTLQPGEPEEAVSFTESYLSGLDAGIGLPGVMGLLDRQDIPRYELPENAPFMNKVAAGLGTLIADAPTMLVGGAITGGPATGPLAMAGAFGLPAGLRPILIDAYSRNEARTFGEAWELMKAALEETGKGMVVGAATGAVRGITAKGGFALRFPAEVATFTKVGNALEGIESEPEDYLVGAAVLTAWGGARRVGGTGWRVMTNVYNRTGKRPAEVVAEAILDPELALDLNSTNRREHPRAYNKMADQKPEESGLKIVRKLVARAEKSEKRQADESEGHADSRRAESEQNIGRHISRNVKPPKTGKMLSPLQKWLRATTDRVYALERAQDMVKSVKDVVADRDFYKLIRNHAGVSGRVEGFLYHGTRDAATRVINGEALASILSRHKIDNHKSSGILSQYLQARRHLELNDIDPKTGKKLTGNLPKRTGEPIKSPFTDAEAYKFVKFHPEFDAVARDVSSFMHRVLQYKRDLGLLTPEEYAKEVALNKRYSPWNRLVEDVSEAFGHEFQISGSDRGFHDPMQTMILKTYSSIINADRNHIKMLYADEVKSTGMNELGFKLEGGATENRAHRSTITFKRKGVEESWSVPREIADAFTSLSPGAIHPFIRWLAPFAAMTRAGAILTPEFMGRNPIKDQVALAMLTKGNAEPFVALAKGFEHLVKKDKIYQDWLDSGGALSTLIEMNREFFHPDIYKILKQDKTMTRVYNTVTSPKEIMNKMLLPLTTLSEASEISTRLGEFEAVFNKAIKEGKPYKEALVEAGFQSRDLIDFAKRGAQMRALSMIDAFLNPKIQGELKVLKEMKADPVGMSIKAGMLITLPSLILHDLNQGEEGYANIPQWQKDLFWLIPLKDDKGVNHWWRIPKPHTLGIVYGSLPERLYDSIVKQDPDAFDGLIQSLGFSATTLAPDALVPALQYGMEKNLHTGQPIIPARMEGIVPQFQHKTYTTETMKALAASISKLPGMRTGNAANFFSSPLQLEQAWRSLAGGAGQHLLAATDFALRKFGAIPDPPRPADTFSDIPFFKGFKIRYPSSSAQPINDFYEAKSEIDIRMNTINYLATELGDMDAMQTELELAGGALGDFNGITKAMAAQSTIYRNALKDKRNDPEELKQIYDDTMRQRIEFAKIGLGIIKDLEKIVVLPAEKDRRRRTGVRNPSELPPAGPAQEATGGSPTIQ